MNGSTSTALPRRSFGETMRADTWWIQPLLVFVGLSTFIVYSTWAAFQGKNYFFGNYVSPFYSPELLGDSPHSWFGPKPAWWPAWLLFSPALLLLWAPGGFRDQIAKSPTCYRAYACVTCLNRRHMLWAWLSLFWVGFTDLYVRLCAIGIWTDFRIV